MHRLKNVVVSVLLVAVAVWAACWLVDAVFKRYEAKYLYAYATTDAGQYTLADFWYNDHGNNIPKKKPDGEYRILVFGDSYTYAVTQPDLTFSAVLQQRLGRTLGRPVRVVNLGFPSISFPEYLELFFFWSQALEYDAVIFNVYLGNDFNDVRDTPYAPRAFAEKLAAMCRTGMAYGANTLVPHKYPFRFLDYMKSRIMEKIYADPKLRRFFTELATPTPALADDTPGPGYKSLMPLSPERVANEMRSAMKPFARRTMFAYENDLPWYQLYLATVSRLAARGVPVLVMLSPPLCAVAPEFGARATRDLDLTAGDIDLALPRRVTLELARRVGLPADRIVDLTPCLSRYTPSGEKTYTEVETHWSVAGNAWVADILAGIILPRWFGRDAEGTAACPQPAPALEPLPEGDLGPANDPTTLADMLVGGCPATRPAAGVQ